MGKIIKAGVEHYFSGGIGSGSDIVILTQEEYDELVTNNTVESGVYYFIEDVNIEGGNNVVNDASDIIYDNSTSGLEADNVQGAVDEVNGKVDEISNDVTELNQNMVCNETVSVLRNSNLSRRMAIQGKMDSNNNPVLESGLYINNGSAIENLVQLYFDGTNFYAKGIKAGADSVTKKLGDPASMIKTKDVSFNFSITAEGNTVTKSVETGVTPISYGMISVTPSASNTSYTHQYKGWISGISVNGTKLVFSCSANTNGTSFSFSGKVRVVYIEE